MRRLTIAGLLIAAALAAAMAWVRLAPVDPRQWHPRLLTDTREIEGACAGSVSPTRVGVIALCSPQMSPTEVLARLDAIALATPRTRRIAGSPEDGRITWETRSAIWGFPDYTTAQAEARGTISRLDIRAQQRFGNGDWGVNEARLRDWLTKFDAS
jgi:uncharacterized protein (DUF1499 family)